jgi:hypothetical protein
VALFNRDAGFPDNESAAYRSALAEITNGRVRVRFEDLPFGLHISREDPGWPRTTERSRMSLSFSKGLARELHGTGVSVTALCPGPSDTPFDRKAGAGRTVLYRYVPKMPPAAVARSAYRGLTRQSSVQIPGLMTKVMAFAGELLPCGIALAVNRLLLTEV